jgi:Fur family transcriptional regulator, peroxide stress response regulator
MRLNNQTQNRKTPCNSRFIPPFPLPLFGQTITFRLLWLRTIPAKTPKITDFKRCLHPLLRFRIIPSIDLPSGTDTLSSLVKSPDKEHMDAHFNERLAARGFRMTSQRERVYGVLLQERDHPTAEQIFFRAKKDNPEISMATVYNCLDALVQCRLVKEVNVDRQAMRYCPNMEEHCHFHCDTCGGVFDIAIKEAQLASQVAVPQGFQVTRVDMSIHGHCPACTAKAEVK